MERRSRKLALSRETLRALNPETMTPIIGGLTETDPRVCTSQCTAFGSCATECAPCSKWCTRQTTCL